jgi:hypothetical protein
MFPFFPSIISLVILFASSRPKQKPAETVTVLKIPMIQDKFWRFTAQKLITYEYFDVKAVNFFAETA